MTDIAALGFAVDSAPLDRSSSSLDKLTGAAKRAEMATNGVTVSSLSEAAAMDRTTGAANRSAAALRLHAAASRMAGNDARMLGFQINDIVVSLASGMNPAMVALQQGSQISQIGLRGLMVVIAPMLPALGLLASLIGAVGVSLAAVTTEINKNQTVQVGWFDVLKAGFEVFGDSIKEKTKPAFDWLGSIWDDIAPKFADNIATIIKNFDLAFRNIKTEWKLLPAALGDSAISAAQSVINAVIWMGREAIANLNGIITHANGLLAAAHLPEISTLGNPNKILPDVTLPNPFAGATGNLQAELAQNFIDVSNSDPLGAIGDRARKDKLAAAADAAKKLGKTLTGPLTDGIDTLTAKTSAWADAATSAFSNMGSSLVDAFTKGGNVAGNVLDMLLGKVADFGTSLLNSGLNSLLNSAIGGITGALTPTGGVLGNGLWGTAIFGGARAGGGPVDAGSTYLVGEKGPELFTPGRSGMISPNGAANQNGGVSYSPTYNLPEGMSRQEALALMYEHDRAFLKSLPDRIAASQRNPYRRSA